MRLRSWLGNESRGGTTMNVPQQYVCPECGAGYEWQEFEARVNGFDVYKRIITCLNCGETQRYTKGERIVENP